MEILSYKNGKLVVNNNGKKVKYYPKDIISLTKDKDLIYFKKYKFFKPLNSIYGDTFTKLRIAMNFETYIDGHPPLLGEFENGITKESLKTKKTLILMQVKDQNLHYILLNDGETMDVLDSMRMMSKLE